MGDSPFSQPSAGGDKFEPKEHPGKLLLIYPKAYDADRKTKFSEPGKPTPAADVDLIVVDEVDPATGGPVVFHDSCLFGNLARSVRSDVGGTVLGRLGQVPTDKGNPAWTLVPHTDADVAMAGPIHQAYQAGQFRQPEAATATAPPAHDPWAGMNATPAPPVASPPAAAPATAPDPNVAKLINNGMDPAKVASMDPQTRALLAASFPG